MTQRKQVNRTPAKKVVRNGKKRKIDRASLIIIIGVIVFAIPCIIVGYELIHAQLGTHSPVIGSRFDNDLDPQITNDQINSIESAVSSLSGVEEATVELRTATLRVYLDVDDSTSAEGATSLAEQAYSSVGSVLDMNTYFSQNNGMKMYDLEIHVYNDLDLADSDNYVYVILNKSSSMEEPRVQTVSEPLDAELAHSLADGTYNQEPSENSVNEDGTVTVGGSEEVIEPTDEETEGETE